MDKNKRCPKCNVLKSIDKDFGRNKNEKNGVAIFCKSCFNLLNKKSRLLKNPNIKPKVRLTPEQKKFNSRIYGKNYKLNDANINLESYIKMLEYQNNKCKICSVIFDNNNRIYIDHCHLKFKVRGLLCVNCNLALGHVKDNVQILNKMIKYLTI